MKTEQINGGKEENSSWNDNNLLSDVNESFTHAKCVGQTNAKKIIGFVKQAYRTDSSTYSTNNTIRNNKNEELCDIHLKKNRGILNERIRAYLNRLHTFRESQRS